jgi:integrase
VRETEGFQPLPGSLGIGDPDRPRHHPQTVGNPQPIVSFEYRVARVPASSAYVSNPDVSLVLAYIDAAGLWEDKKASLFRATNGKSGILSERALDREDAFHMIRRRARQAGIETKIGCHTFRATGITIYLTNGGDLEKAQQMAAHESPRTTKLYDRRSDAVSLDEVEKVVF